MDQYSQQRPGTAECHYLCVRHIVGVTALAVAQYATWW